MKNTTTRKATLFIGAFQTLFTEKFKSDPLGIHRSKTEGKAIPILRKFGLYHPSSAQHSDEYSLPAVSRLSPSYYERFALESVKFPNSYPFALVLAREKVSIVTNFSREDSEESKESSHLKGKKSLLHVIDYEDESAYDVVYHTLTELDKRILRVISEFRNVQQLQLYRELGEKTNRIEKSLHRLNSLYLIQKHRFIHPVSEDKQYAFCYSIYSHGTYLLMKYMDLSPRYAYKWKESQRREDPFTAIRQWKIMDAYLNFRFHKDFAGFVPYDYLEGFTYTEKKELGQNRFSNTSNKHIEYTRTVRRMRIDGQIRLYDKDTDTTTKFDLYPFITMDKEDSDLSKLGEVFKHYGNLHNGFDKDGDKRFLLIIVDDSSMIEVVENEYRLSNHYVSLPNILFMDLSESSSDFFSSIKRIQLSVEGHPELRTIQFSLSEAITEK